MAIQHKPKGDAQSFDLIRYFRPVGSDTLVWAKDMANGQLVRLLRWGSEIYLPTYDGMQIGIGIINASPLWRAYPIYIEALNLWDGGPGQPESCDVNHMWELRPFEQMVVDKLMNPARQTGRPLIVTEAGLGQTIGEASFGTEEYRGQIRVYERLQVGGGFQQQRETNQGQGLNESVTSKSYSDEWRGALESNVRGGVEPDSFSLRGLGGVRGGHAGIGAGAETHQSHQYTGVNYQLTAQPVVFLRTEYQYDLQPMLNSAWGAAAWSWYEPFPTMSNWWNDSSWTWRKSRPTAPQVPVIHPHRPKR